MTLSKTTTRERNISSGLFIKPLLSDCCFFCAPDPCDFPITTHHNTQVDQSHPQHELLVDTLKREQAQGLARMQTLFAKADAVGGAQPSVLPPSQQQQQQQCLSAPNQQDQQDQRQEFLVKWRNMSYLHAEWVPSATVQVGSICSSVCGWVFVSVNEHSYLCVCVCVCLCAGMDMSKGVHSCLTGGVHIGR